MERNHYGIIAYINGRRLLRLVIDQHYMVKHHRTINDALIIKLVMMLSHREFLPENRDQNGYQYFTEDQIKLGSKRYKLIWVLKEDENFIGVINCYRRD